jgi:ribose 5-phosphate isomerase B
MRLAIGSDERTHTTDEVISRLKQAGHELSLYGPLADESGPWPEVAQQVAESIAEGTADEGILFCWTGTGVSIAANKVPGIRAALCDDAETAHGARLWNNANVLCLSLRRVSAVITNEILDQWFATSYQPNPDDDACLIVVEKLEAKYTKR